MLINFIISVVYKLMFSEEKDRNKDLYELSTRKIISHSNLLLL
jgi:hypothetical protein